jgi:hypothetical protein
VFVVGIAVFAWNALMVLHNLDEPFSQVRKGGVLIFLIVGPVVSLVQWVLFVAYAWRVRWTISHVLALAWTLLMTLNALSLADGYVGDLKDTGAIDDNYHPTR